MIFAIIFFETFSTFSLHMVFFRNIIPQRHNIQKTFFSASESNFFCKNTLPCVSLQKRRQSKIAVITHSAERFIKTTEKSCRTIFRVFHKSADRIDHTIRRVFHDCNRQTLAEACTHHAVRFLSLSFQTANIQMLFSYT